MKNNWIEKYIKKITSDKFLKKNINLKAIYKVPSSSKIQILFILNYTKILSLNNK